jgi:hypothetical protein
MIDLETREQVLQRVCKKAGLVLVPGQAVEITFRRVDDKYQIFANGKLVGRITFNAKQKLPYRIAIFGKNPSSRISRP